MKKEAFAIFALAMAVLVSGCVQGGNQTVTTPTNVGLAMTGFYSSTDEVVGCDKTVRLTDEIENQGGHTLKKNDTLACLLGTNFPGKTSESLWANGTAICQKLAKNKLGAADTENGIPGGMASFKWTVFSPYIQYPLTREDTFTARLYYKYQSTVATTLWIYNEDELTAEKQRGETVPSSIELQKTVGPVDISIDVPQYPVVAENGESFTIKVTVSNNGDGTVFNNSIIDWGSSITTPPSIPSDDLNVLSIDLEVPTGLDASGVGYCAEDLKEIELRKGESVTIPCDIKINEDITTKKSYPIRFTATYGYYSDKSVSVKVSGKKNQDSSECSKG